MNVMILILASVATISLVWTIRTLRRAHRDRQKLDEAGINGVYKLMVCHMIRVEWLRLVKHMLLVFALDMYAVAWLLDWSRGFRIAFLLSSVTSVCLLLAWTSRKSIRDREQLAAKVKEEKRLHPNTEPPRSV